MRSSALIVETVKKYPELEIIDAQKLYKDKFSKVSEQAFYKTISRLSQSGEVRRLTKGLYYIPKKENVEIRQGNEEKVLQYFLGPTNNKGVIVGSRMYHNQRLTNQFPEDIIMYSNNLTQEKRRIGHIVVRRALIRFDKPAVKMIELLDVLQNYKNISDMNKMQFLQFLKDAAVYYDNKTLGRILSKIRYKKSTLASLEQVLSYFGIHNTVGQYLNGISNYDSIRMEEWVDPAPPC